MIIPVLKLAGISAILSAGVVTAYEGPKATAAASAKLFQDRIEASAPNPTLLADASAGAASGCSAQAWPYVSASCVVSDAGPARRPVRTITIERRDAPNSSTLVRVSAEPAR